MGKAEVVTPRSIALVVGVDQYADPGVALSSAVLDAVAFVAWLLRPDGGALGAGDVTLLLAPRRELAADYDASLQADHQGRITIDLAAGVVRLRGDDGAEASIQYLPATRAALLQAVLLPAERHGPRLYFYFSGHGLQNEWDGFKEDAILPSDFESQLTANSLGVRALLAQLQAFNFADQFVFIDACRDMPFVEPFRIGSIDRPVRPRGGLRRRVPQQFVMLATSPGRRSTSSALLGGAFTGTLLRGLGGEGSAKRWDDDTQEYVVRFVELFEHVLRALAARPTAGAGGAQTARSLGERGALEGSNPVLARITPDKVPKTTLKIVLTPRGDSKTRYQVWYGPRLVAELTDVAKPPVSFDLAPRQYHVTASLAGFHSVPDQRVVSVYEPTQARLSLSKDKGAPSGDAPPAAAETDAAVTYSDLVSGELFVHADDPQTFIDVVDEAGVVATPSAGNAVTLTGARPGYYKVRKLDKVANRMEPVADVVVKPGKRTSFALPSAQRALKGPALAFALEAYRPPTADLASGFGGAWDALVTTPPGLAAAALARIDALIGTALVVVLLDARSNGAGGTVSARSKAANGAMSERPIAADERLGSPAAAVVDPAWIGPDTTLRFRPSAGLALDVPVAALRGGGLLVVSFDGQGRPDVFLGTAAPTPEGFGAHARLLATIERLWSMGRLQHAVAAARAVAQTSRLTQLFEALLGTRLGLDAPTWPRVAVPGDEPAEPVPSSDLCVLRGVLMDRDGHDPRDAFEEAIAEGLPSSRLALELLTSWAGGAGHAAAPALEAALARAIEGMWCTAWNAPGDESKAP